MKSQLSLLVLCSLLATSAEAQLLTAPANLARFSGKLATGEADVGVQNYGVNGGYSLWSPQGHANWNVVQSSVQYNPTEWQVYPNAAQGIAQSQSGTGNLVLQSGTNFSANWVGLPYLYFAGTRYKVSAVTDSTHLTVQTTGGGAVSFGSTANDTYYFLTTSATSTCNVNGTAVTWTAGQPFIPFIDLLYINGVLSSVSSYNSPTSITLSSSGGTLTGATCVTYKNINDELSVLRLQGLYGSNEENFAITETPAGTLIQRTYAGSGKYRPILVQDGEAPGGTMQTYISIRPNATLGNDGTMGIGGDTNVGNQTIAIALNHSAVNYWKISAAGTGVAPSLQLRGSDTDVSGGIDMQGAGTLSFTSHSFTNPEFKIFGSGAADYLAVASNAGSPTISANGTDSNVNIKLAPKGAGFVQATGLVLLQGYTVSGLPSCGGSTAPTGSLAYVTDANGPTYNSTLSGGGSSKVLAFCNGSNWQAH